MGFKIGEIEEEDGRVGGLGDPYIQKLLKKDNGLSELWDNVGNMFEEKVPADKKKTQE